MKKILSIILSIALLVFIPFSIGASSYLDNFAIPTLIVNKFDLTPDKIDKITPLYNVDENIIAYCIERIDSGYVIYDLNDMPIEYSYEEHSSIYNIEQRIYMSGPSNFFIKENNRYRNILNDDIVYEKAQLSKNIIVEAQKNYKNQNSLVSPRSITSGHISYETRLYATNTSNKRCMATAGASLIAYYDDHINGNVAPSNHVNSDGFTLTGLLEPRMYKESSVSWAMNCRDTFNWYFSTYSTGSAKSYTATSFEGSSYDVWTKLMGRINNNRPLEVFISGTPNHAVVACGWENDTNFQLKSFHCDYGYGSTKWINATYLYAAIWINA